MADTKLSDLPALTAVAAGDLFYVVDISDTTDDAAGSSKKITQANLVGAFANTFVVGQTIAPAVATGSPAPALLITGAAHTALTASTENVGVNLNLSATKQFATGALTTQREVLIQAPTYSAVGASTITDASTFVVTGAPIAGTNVTITNAYAARFGNKVRIDPPAATDITSIFGVYHSNGNPSLRVNTANYEVWIGNDAIRLDINGIQVPTTTNSIYASGWASYGVINPKLRWPDAVSPTVALNYSASGILEINNDTAGRWAALKLGAYDSGTTTITDGLTVGHRSSGTPATGLGSAILFNIDSTTTADQAAGRLSFSWATATHASRLSKAALSVYDVSTSRDAIVCEAISGGVKNTLYGTQVIQQVGGTPGTDEGQIYHDGTNLYIQNMESGGNTRVNITIRGTSYSFGDATAGGMYAPDAIGAVAGLKTGSGSYIGFTDNSNPSTGIETYFYRVSAGVVGLNIGSAGQWGALKVGTYDSGTNTITDGLTVGHQSSGTPASGLGSAILFNINSTTTADQNAARLQSSWTVPTHASRTSEVGIKTVTNAGSLAEVARFDGGGGASPSAGNTGLMIWDVDNNTLERVTVGPADSGGTGYKVLRILN